jgi:hypothetical protein
MTSHRELRAGEAYRKNKRPFWSNRFGLERFSSLFLLNNQVCLTGLIGLIGLAFTALPLSYPFQLLGFSALLVRLDIGRIASFPRT